MNAAERNSGRAAHRQVVHGAVNRQPADIAAGEKEGAYHERVRREGDPQGLDAVGFFTPREGRLVLQSREHRVVEGRYEQPLDEVGGQPSATAVTQQDPIVPGERRRAGVEQLGMDRVRLVAHQRPPPIWTKEVNSGVCAAMSASRRRP